MFVDEVILDVKAGSGGNGVIAFRREKNVPLGGPAGGNGGSGGNIKFIVDEGLSTLLDLKYQKLIKADRGEHGQGKNMHGKKAQDKVIKVPIGTVVYEEPSGRMICDLTRHLEECVIARGGRGGRGNTAFRTQANPAPNFSENGEPGEEKRIRVELKVLADVGLVGMPSVGKSTFLSVVTHSKPKIAEYHFTTLHPNLGVVKTSNHNSFVIADLPGLIEGASLGEGLGLQFLKHIERTKVIAHIVDMGSSEGRDPYDDYLTINEELKAFDESLLKRPTIIIANKMDLPNAEDNLQIFSQKVKEKIFPVSAITKKGLEPVLEYLQSLVKEMKYNAVKNCETKEHQLYEFTEELPFTITRDNNTWIVDGKEIKKLVIMTNFSTDEGFRRFSYILRQMGMDNELAKAGAKEGDTVRVYDIEFEYKNG